MRPLKRILAPLKMAPAMVAVLLALKMPVEPSRHALIIQGGSVIDTRTGKVLENGTVVIEGGRITRVAPANEVAIPPDAQVVDARDRWILPGLIDMHVHRAGQPDLVPWGVLTREDIDKINASKSVTVREAMVWRHVDLKSPHITKLIAQLAAAKTVLDPTLSTDEYDSLFLFTAQASHPNNLFLRQSFVDEALGAEHQILKVPRELEADARSGVEKRRAFVGMCHRAGVKIIAGTDGPGIGHLSPGFGLHRELELLVMAGLTPSDALRAATFEAAAALGHEKDLGTVAEGKLADLVMVRADPRLNIANATQIEAVVLRGRFLDRTTLDAMLDQVAAEAKGPKVEP